MKLHERRELVYAVLRRIGAPATAARICDETIGVCQAQGVDGYRAITPSTINADLQQLQRQARVRIESRAKGDRSRREEPQWEPVDGYDAAAQLPTFWPDSEPDLSAHGAALLNSIGGDARAANRAAATEADISEAARAILAKHGPTGLALAVDELAAINARFQCDMLAWIHKHRSRT